MSCLPARAQQMRHRIHSADMRSRTCGRVRRMFALSTQNWWWTAHPAAH
ncbi:trp operon leader peptide [Streptomyces griseochromogenes]